jgi:multidrug efflux pump subunit AcrA (membrane-fusion protein)
MKQTLNEQVARIKAMMNLNEDDSQAMLQQDTLEFNQQVDEDLTPEEFKEVMCSDPNEIELPQELGNEEKQKAEEFRAAASKASLAELKAAKQQIKQLKRQQQDEQVAAPALVTILGVSMNPGVAIAVGVVLFALVLSFLSKLFRTRTTTYYCDGTRSRGLFGLLRW